MNASQQRRQSSEAKLCTARYDSNMFPKATFSHSEQASNGVVPMMRSAQAPNKLQARALKGRCRSPYPSSPRRTSFSKLGNQAQPKIGITTLPTFFYGSMNFFFFFDATPCRAACARLPTGVRTSAEPRAHLPRDMGSCCSKAKKITTFRFPNVIQSIIHNP